MRARSAAGSHRCYHAEAAHLVAAGRRAVESPDALADPAEVMLRSELE